MKAANLAMGAAIVCGFMLAGCATPLATAQKQELRNYEAKGMLIEEKSPAAGAALGLLPGFGSFYTRNYGYGVINLLFWPLSILWDPVSGYDGAVSINYYATKTAATSAMKKEMTMLDRALEDGRIAQADYLKSKRNIEDRYSGEF